MKVNLKSQSYRIRSFLTLLIALTFSFVYAQKTSFDLALENIIENKPSEYHKIESELKAFHRDSLEMKRLLVASQAKNYYEGTSYALNALGVIQRNISNYETSIDLHKQAKQLADKANSDEFKIVSLNMIGVAYRRMDVIKLALDYHTEALKIAYNVEEPSKTVSYNIAVSQNSIGNIYLALEQYDLAIEQFNKSLKLEKAADNKLGLAINYHNIGYAEEAKGNLDAALNNYNKSLNYNNAINSEIGRVICYNSIGGVYLKKENYKDAEPIIKEAMEKAIKLNDQFYIASSYINLGQLQLKLNELTAAQNNLKKALKISKKYNLKSSEAQSGKLLAKVNTKNNNYEAALDYYTQAVEIENTILTEKNLQYVNDIVVEYENQNKNNQIKALASENEAVRLRLERNKKVVFYATLAIAVLGIAFFIAYRNRALKNEKHILTLEQDMLRSQMNPHFIFNSLNSIKLYIINNEKENAVYYLNKFSKLIRKILIASKEKETSLKEELETMQLYMNIENIRFSNEINFKINIENSINLDVIKVPSLILQPFLENSLWHGLSSKSKDKNIELNVKPKGTNFVTIEIIDNGIGRTASAKIHESKRLKRKSVGIELTKARLANFSKAFKENYEIYIEDLYTNNKPSGTKVTINLPQDS